MTEKQENWVKFYTHAGKENNIGVITLDRPDALNALSLSMILAVTEQLQAWKEDSDINAVFITGNGRAFCAGGDIRALYENGTEHVGKSMIFFNHEYKLNQLIHHYPKPYIAYCDGITMGGGVGISTHGSHRIATPNFQFAMPEVKIGFFPDIGARSFLTKCPGYTGLYLALTGAAVDARTSLGLGLVDQVIPAGQVEQLLTLIGDCEITDENSLTDRITSQLLAETGGAIEDEELINEHFFHDSLDKIIKSLTNDSSEWANNLHQALTTSSAHSLSIIFDAYHRARNQTFDVIIRDDLDYAQDFLQHPDFYEGIRAMLIDKDKSPVWE